VSWLRADGTALWFWVLWALTIPFLAMLFRRDRYGREAATLAMLQSATAMFGIGATAELSRENLGALGFCGLCTSTYLLSAQFLPKPKDEQPHPLTQLGMIGVGVMAVLLSFEWMWDFSAASARLAPTPNAVAILVQLGWPVIAMLLVGTSLRWRREVQFNYVAAFLPVMAGITWVLMRSLGTSPAYSDPGKFIGALLFDGYALTLGVFTLGVFTLVRGLKAYRIGEANLGLLIVQHSLPICTARVSFDFTVFRQRPRLHNSRHRFHPCRTRLPGWQHSDVPTESGGMSTMRIALFGAVALLQIGVAGSMV